MYKNAHDILRINNVFVFFSNKYWIGCKNIKKTKHNNDREKQQSINTDSRVRNFSLMQEYLILSWSKYEVQV